MQGSTLMEQSITEVYEELIKRRNIPPVWATRGAFKKAKVFSARKKMCEWPEIPSLRILAEWTMAKCGISLEYDEHLPAVGAYCHVKNKVEMLPKARWRSTGRYYGTLFHEIGHAYRRAQLMHNTFMHSIGNRAFEEIIAESTAFFVCATHQTDEEIFESIEFIRLWAEVLDFEVTTVRSALTIAGESAHQILHIDTPTEMDTMTEIKPLKSL